MANGSNISLQQREEFNRFVFNHLENLGSIAQASPLVFATGKAYFSTSLPINGLVQCTRDMTGRKCNECLSKILTTGMNCTHGKTGGRILARSCYVRYQDSPFYRIADSSPEPVMAPEKFDVKFKRGEYNSLQQLLYFLVYIVCSRLYCHLSHVYFISLCRKTQCQVNSNTCCNISFGNHPCIHCILLLTKSNTKTQVHSTFIFL
jgi:Salt stress response/antifungal